MNRRTTRTTLCACLGAIGLLPTASVLAVDRTWVAANDRFFSDMNAWSGAAVPGLSDNALFNPSGAYSVLFITSPFNQIASVAAGTVSFDLGGRQYSLIATGTTSLVVGTSHIFGITAARLNVGGTGTLQTQSAQIGSLMGPGDLSLGSASWNTTGTLTIGNNGTGSVEINASGIATTANAVLGASSGSTGNITIGNTGTLALTGTTFAIGAVGNGNLTINPGGRLICNAFNADTYLGRDAGSRGTVNIAGGSWTTVLSASGGTIEVGYSGSGTINASSGTLSCHVIQLGTNAGGAGSLNVSGTANVSTGAVGVGGIGAVFGGAGGAGRVTVRGGTLNAGDVYLYGGGTMTLSGGRLSVSSFADRGGTFEWASGSLSLMETLIIARGRLVTSLTLDASRTLQAPSVEIGDISNAGTLNITNTTCTAPMLIDGRGVVTVTNALGTLNSISDGSLTVNDGTIAINSNIFIRGNAGAGAARFSGSRLINNFAGGAVVVGQGAEFGTLLLTAGSAANLPGTTLNVEGFAQIDASSWTSTQAGTANIGLVSFGTLDIRNGSTMAIGSANLGDAASAHGSVNVSGAGSTWTVGNTVGTGTILVGKGGTGTLNVTNSAHVNATNFFAGQLAGSRGSVLVDAAGLSIQQDLHVGEAGTGSLTVTGGGSLQCAHGFVGRIGNGIGTVILTGPGSSWTGTTGIDVGGGQSAWFTLAAGATLTPGGTITVGANSVFDYSGGSIGTTTLVLNTGHLRGSGAFTQPIINTNGVIEATGGTLTLTAPFTTAAASTLTKIGPGIAELSNYVSAGAGTVNANDGTLRIASDLGPAGHSAVANINQAAVDFSATQHLAALNITSGRATLLTSGSQILVTSSFMLTGSSAMLNLADNDFQYNYFGPSPYDTIAGYIRTARNGGLWDGPGGITSSAAAVAQPARNTALGLMEGFQYHALYGNAAQFDGQDVFNSSMLVKYTWYGDTDLNGVVNFDDYARIDNGFNSGGTDWFHGDFDYNGVVNFDDYALIDLAFNTQTGTLRRAMSYLDGGDRSDHGMSPASLQLVQQHFEQFGGAFASSFLSAVPEPGSLAGCCALIGLTLMRRRRSDRLCN